MKFSLYLDPFLVFTFLAPGGLFPWVSGSSEAKMHQGILGCPYQPHWVPSFPSFFSGVFRSGSPP